MNDPKQPCVSLLASLAPVVFETIEGSEVGPASLTFSRAFCTNLKQNLLPRPDPLLIAPPSPQVEGTYVYANDVGTYEDFEYADIDDADTCVVR